MKRIIFRVVMLWAALTLSTLAPMALGQQTPAQVIGPDDYTLSGTVVSTSLNTLVVRTDSGRYVMFVFNRYTVKPTTLAAGTMVRVWSMPTDELGVRLATDVIVTGAPPTAPAAGAGGAGTPAGSSEPVPASVREMERDLQRQAKKFGMGFRAGVGLDPELILFGIQARFGPFFDRSLSFRPSAEFGFGEVTKQITINLDAVFRLPFTPTHGRWSAYAGTGPALGFGHRDFQAAEEGDQEIDFGDFEYKAGLNIFTGVEFRKGTFFELRTTVWATPHVRFIFGYNF